MDLRQILTVAFLAALAVGSYIYYEEFVLAPSGQASAPPQRGPRTVSVEVEPAQARALSVVLEAVGTTGALRSVDIVPQAEGQITQIDVVAGREIATGAVIARLDDDNQQANLAEASATLKQKQRALERFETLLRSNNVSYSAVDLARSEQAVAQAALDRARAALNDRVVRAPFDGVLGITSLYLGARVDTGTVLTTLDDLSAVEIEFTLPETVYGQIEIGQPVTATTSAYAERTFTGEVAAVDSRIGSTSRAFRVRARIPNADRALPAGMFMRLSLATGTRDAVMVSEEAIVLRAGVAMLFVAADGVASLRRIDAGQRRVGMVEVLEGVSAGEMVITRGVQSLQEGIEVNVVGGGTPPLPPPDRTTLPNDNEIPAAARQDADRSRS